MASEVTWQGDPPEKLLKERFHISTGFHQGQRDIIEQLVQGKRFLVIQRTGWGKSLCNQKRDICPVLKSGVLKNARCMRPAGRFHITAKVASVNWCVLANMRMPVPFH